MLSVSDGIPDDLYEMSAESMCRIECLAHIFKEDLQDTTRFLINETRDTLHTATTSKTANSWLGYTYEQH